MTPIGNPDRWTARTAARAFGVSAAMACALLLSGCGSDNPVPTAIEVSGQVDASGSGEDADFYFQQFARALEERQGQAMTVSVIAIGRTTDPAEVCPPVGPLTVAPDPNAEDPDAAWKASARKLLAQSKALFECAQAADVDGSAITGFEHARGADQLWLFTDGMFNDSDIAIRAGKLDDPAYVDSKVGDLPKGDSLAGVAVSVFGVGVNAGLSNSELEGLRTVLAATVKSQGGRISEMGTY